MRSGLFTVTAAWLLAPSLLLAQVPMPAAPPGSYYPVPPSPAPAQPRLAPVPTGFAPVAYTQGPGGVVQASYMPAPAAVEGVPAGAAPAGVAATPYAPAAEPVYGGPEGTPGSGCGPNGCGAGGCAAPPLHEETPYTFWFSGEYLLWHIKDARVPPLQVLNTMPVANTTVPLNTQAPNGVPLSQINAVSFQEATIFPTGSKLGEGERSGGRITVGAWLDADHDVGIEVRGFDLERKGTDALLQQLSNFPINTPVIFIPGGTSQALTTTATTTLTTPTGTSTVTSTVTTPGMTVAVPVSGGFLGAMNVVAQATLTNRLDGAEANITCHECWFGTACFDFFGGFRYVNFQEDLAMNESVSISANNNLMLAGAPSSLSLANARFRDDFNTRNQFYGAQLGANVEWHECRWVLACRPQIALGEMHQVVGVSGANTALNAVGTVIETGNGGLLTQPGDIGRHSRERFSYVPEVTASLGYEFTPRLTGFVSYDFLDIAHVARAGDQVGVSETATTVAVGGATTTANIRTPEFRFWDTNMWVQGINFGLAYRY